MIKGWVSYKHALLPTTPPHEMPDLEILKNRNLWKNHNIMIRYTTDFDCGHETQWWYVIKDDEIEIDKLKSNKKYKIRYGLKNFNVVKISPTDHSKELYKVYCESFEKYKLADKPLAEEGFLEQCRAHSLNKAIEYYAAFEKDTNVLAAYSFNTVFDDFVNLTTLKFSPQHLSKHVAAALIYQMIFDYLNVQKKQYVNNGERSIRHITNFNQYLIDYFGFRKAYCTLHITYRPISKLILNILYPFRKVIKKMDSNVLIHNICSMLDMESIRRSFKNE